jgi:adenosylmethionine-8-amino-7-oxononanoate aminotransferase
MRNDDRVFHRDVTRDYPVVDRAEGIHIYDTAGRRYIDCSGSVFVQNVGHGVSEIIDAIADQARRVAFVNTAQFTSDAEQRLSGALVDLAPPGFVKAWMSTTGSTANETAIKLARQYHLLTGNPQKTRVIARHHSYHGSSLGALSMTGAAQRRRPYEPYLADFPHIDPPYCYRCPLATTYPECGVACADELEKTILQVGPQYVSAFMVEPAAGGTLGALVAKPEYLPRIREICDRYDVLMMVDEVVSGLGRTGRFFAVEHWGVVPDIITLGKGLGGGYVPLAAVLAHQRVYGAFEDAGTSFVHGETFTGHTTTCAAGDATLKYMAEHKLVERSAEMGAVLGERLESLRPLPMVGDVRGLGLLRGIELVRDKETREPFPRERGITEAVVREASDRGLLLLSGSGGVDGVNGDTVMLSPPYILTADDIEEIVSIIEASIVKVAKDQGVAA